MSDAQNLFVLHETAAGYGLFEIISFEEIGTLLEGSRDTVSDLSRFSRAVKLKAFQPFESAQDALSNANAISEHAMTEQLKHFLEMNVPMEKKKSKKSKGENVVALGVIDPALATAITDGIDGLSCRSDDTVREILRGCRLHLGHFVKGLKGHATTQAQLGLGHSYSRSKVKFNPARSDNMIIQTIALLDQMDKDLNTFAMRVREWYSWHFPELKDLVKDNYMFARCAAFIQDKGTLFVHPAKKGGEEEGDEDQDDDNGGETMEEDKLPGLIEIVGDTETANAIIAAARTSMGMDCSAVDMVNIINFTQRMVKLAEYRKQLAAYLTDKMAVVAPNLSALIGDTVAARLISKAGSLTNLAKSPASTVQILGAEKALFRALKTKGNTPKYGLIYHSTFIGRADAKNKGRISRYLANKCSIATRIDSFADEPTSAYGEKLRDQVEERLKFYETGAAPRKNVDVMAEVARHLAAGKKDDEKKEKEEDGVDMEDAEEMKTPSKKDKKKKKKKDKQSTEKKKKRKASEVEEEAADAGEETKEQQSSSKKRRVEEKVADDDGEDEAAKRKAAKKAAKKAKKEAATPKKSGDADDDDEPKSSSKKAKKDDASEEAAKTPKKSAADAEATTPKSSEKKSSKKKKKKSKSKE